MDAQQEIIPVTKTNALAAFKDGDAKERSLLIRLLGKKHFTSDMTELIKSFEDACEFNNTNPNDHRFTQGTEAGNNMEMLAEIAKALNGGRVMKPGEKRFYPVFIHDEAGFRLYDVYCDISNSYSSGGPRLCLAEERLAKYMGTQFQSFYNRFYNPAQ